MRCVGIIELQFLAGDFFDFVLPKEKQYLFRYFTTNIEKQFIKYYFCFGEYECFTDHTGLYCQKRWLGILKLRLDELLAAHAAAKREIDLELLAYIESGGYKLKTQ